MTRDGLARPEHHTGSALLDQRAVWVQTGRSKAVRHTADNLGLRVDEHRAASAVLVEHPAARRPLGGSQPPEGAADLVARLADVEEDGGHDNIVAHTAAAQQVKNGTSSWPNL